jgi:hypothetical protein
MAAASGLLLLRPFILDNESLHGAVVQSQAEF